MRPHGSPEELEKRRKKAISLSRKGNQTIEIAHVIGTTRRSIRRWKAAFRTQGAEGIRSKPSPGRPTKLSEEQKRDLEQELLKGAKAFGYLSDLWTCPRIAQLISHQYGVLYHVDHIGRLLHSLGWSPQKPQRRPVERDDQKVATWIKEEWPRIKKNEAPESNPGFPGRKRSFDGSPCASHMGADRQDAMPFSADKSS